VSEQGRRAVPFVPAVVLVLEGRVPAGGQAALEEFLAEASRYYEEPGGIRVRLHWDRGDACRFREIIEYESMQGFEADDERTRSDNRMREYLARWRRLLDGDSSVTVWNPVEFGLNV